MVQVGGVAIGFLTDFSMDAKAELIKEYANATGLQAQATATVTSQTVTAVTVTLGGLGYNSAPAVTISGGGGSGATATAIIASGVVIAVTVTAPGSGYTSTPTVSIAAPTAIVASAQPAFIASGNQSITFKASTLFVPSSYATLLNDVLGGAFATIIWGPQGTTTGQSYPKITLNNVTLTAYSVKNGQKGVIAHDINGEAQTITQSTF